MQSADRNSNVSTIGKLQNKIALPYDFSIGKVLSEAWRRVKGAKATYWAAMGYFFLSFIGLSVICGIAIGIFAWFFGGQESLIVKTFAGIIYTIFYLVILPMNVGVSYIGVRRSVDLPIRSKQIFGAYHFYWRLVGAFLSIFFIMFAIIFISVFLLAFLQGAYISAYGQISDGLALVFTILKVVAGVAGFYFMFAFAFAPLLIVEKKFGVIQALKTSLHAFNQHWFKIIVIHIVMILIYVISLIPLMLGIIWTLPMFINISAILYRTMFGVERDF